MRALYSYMSQGFARSCGLTAAMCAVLSALPAFAAPATPPVATRPAATTKPSLTQPGGSALQPGRTPVKTAADQPIPICGSRAGEKELPLIRDLKARFESGGPRVSVAPPAATQPTAPAVEEPLVVRVFKLKHIDSKTVLNAISTAWGDKTTRVSASPDGNVVVRTTEGAMAAIAQLLEHLDRAPDRSRETMTIILSLKYAKADELASVIPRVVPGARECLAWRATNSLLLSGSPEAIEVARTLISQLDVKPTTPPPAPPANDSVTKVFMLKAVRPNEALIDALKAAAGEGSSVIMEPDRHALIVTARPKGLLLAESVLHQIDQPHGESESSAVRLRVRFLWLVSGLPPDKSAPPPDDLLPLVEDLQRIGVTGLRLATQSIVETTPGRRFVMRASPALANRCDLELQGRFVDEAASRPSVELRAKVVEYAPYVEPEKNGYKVFEKRDLCEMETTVVAPLGKAIVAGVTPIDRMTAVFVVQVLPQ